MFKVFLQRIVGELFLWKYSKEAKDELSSVVKSFPAHDINMDSATNVYRSLDIQQEQT